MESRPYIQALTGSWYPKKYDGLRQGQELNNYYKVRAKIMRECYLKGWNPKEITGYFKVQVDQFYKFCDVKKLKNRKSELCL